MPTPQVRATGVFNSIVTRRYAAPRGGPMQPTEAKPTSRRSNIKASPAAMKFLGISTESVSGPDCESAVEQTLAGSPANFESAIRSLSSHLDFQVTEIRPPYLLPNLRCFGQHAAVPVDPRVVAEANGVDHEGIADHLADEYPCHDGFGSLGNGRPSVNT